MQSDAKAGRVSRILKLTERCSDCPRNKSFLWVFTRHDVQKERRSVLIFWMDGLKHPTPPYRGGFLISSLNELNNIRRQTARIIPGQHY